MDVRHASLFCKQSLNALLPMLKEMDVVVSLYIGEEGLFLASTRAYRLDVTKAVGV